MNTATTAFQRHFVADVKRCDEMERKVRFLREQLERGIDSEPVLEVALPNASPLQLDELEARLEKEEQDLYERARPRVALFAHQCAASRPTGARKCSSATATSWWSSSTCSRRTTSFSKKPAMVRLFFLGGLPAHVFCAKAFGAGAAGGNGKARVNEDSPLLRDDDADEQESFFAKAAASLGFVTGVVESSKVRNRVAGRSSCLVLTSRCSVFVV